MRVGKEGSSRERTAAFALMLSSLSSMEHGSQTATPPPFSPVNLPNKHRTPMRSSIEGLNQEIERLVLKATSTLSTEREEEKVSLFTGFRYLIRACTGYGKITDSCVW